MKDTRILYGFEDSERLYEDPDELLEAALDDCDIASISKTATIHEYTRAEVAEVNLDRLLEQVYERLDEEYGDPDGDFPDIPEQVVCAARLLANAIRRTYKPWLCVQTGVTFEVDQHEFFRDRWPEHADKLTDGKGEA